MLYKYVSETEVTWIQIISKSHLEKLANILITAQVFLFLFIAFDIGISYKGRAF